MIEYKERTGQEGIKLLQKLDIAIDPSHEKDQAFFGLIVHLASRIYDLEKQIKTPSTAPMSTAFPDHPLDR